MTGRSKSLLLLWRFVLMLICIRRSKDLLEQFQEFECNNSFFAFDSCVYCTTHYNKCGRIGTIWLYFFAFIKECCVMMKKNIGKKLANRISHQIWYKRCLKGKFSGGRGEGGGVQICERGSYPLADLNREGGPIRCDTGLWVHLKIEQH